MNFFREGHRKGKFLLVTLYFLLKKHSNFCSESKKKQRDFTHKKVSRQFIFGFAYRLLPFIRLPLSPMLEHV